MAPKKNAYFYYMIEFQRNQKARGHEISIAEASTMASNSWKNLTDVEKEKYKKMAKAENEKTIGPPKSQAACVAARSVYTAQGIPLRMVEAEEKRKLEAKNEVNQIIRKMLLDGKRGLGIDTIQFSFIHMNMFFENFPCELAVSKFSIDRGVFGTYHTLIKVDKLPLGAAFEAKTQSEKVHGLPVPPSAIGNDDHYSILYDLRTFVGTGLKAMLFCRPEDIENVKNGLAYLDKDCESSSENFLIIDIVELFYQMHKLIFAGQPLGDVTYGAVKIILDRDPFDSFVKGCEEHDTLDRNVNCSVSITKRLAYQFIDTFAKTFGTVKQSGVHYPATLQNFKPTKEEDTDVESLMHEFHIGTSDETSSCYESEATYESKMTKQNLNDTNPFKTHDWSKFGARPKQTSQDRYEDESEFDCANTSFATDLSDDEDNLNMSFQAAKFKKLLQEVRDGTWKK
ncbi:protein maelstrom homolog [Culicoides brevitarsis]|uniref:protein maelstrom homolog n=1 Tax=Culicoides brevitarsis TaxID=469753 RepID=UPI00307C67C0